MSPISPADATELWDLKSRYFYYLDTKQWDRLHEVFWPDARFEGFAFPADSAADFVRTVSHFLADVTSTHHGYQPRFRHVADGGVRGVWAMHDHLEWEPDSRIYKDIPVPGMRGIHGYGYYEDEYERRAGVWRARFSRLVRTRIDPVVDVAPRPRYDVMGPDLRWLED